MKKRTIIGFALIQACLPALVQAQFSEVKMGEYLHYATAAANGGIYAGINGIGYTTVFGTPAIYNPSNGWGDLPISQGFNTSLQITGAATAISHDGSVVAGYVTGTTTNGVAKQVACYWSNGIESIVPAPPDDAGAITVTATAISGDGTTLLVQDGTVYSATVETFLYHIPSGAFTTLGFLGVTNHQTFATAINSNGTVVAGYSSLDNGNNNGFIWTSNGVTVLATPDNHPNTFYLEPSCMSDDGTTIYGQLTEGGGWEGFRYTVAHGYEDINLAPSACTADGAEVVGIEFMYFPALWTVNNGGGYLDHLVTENITQQALNTTRGPVTISPDGTAITLLGPDAYLTDQTWFGTWLITVPSPLKTAPIPMATQNLATDYQTTLNEPAGTLTQYAEFNTGTVPHLVHKPRYASSFSLNADGSFSYTPQAGYISAGLDPETGTPTDTFTYQLVSSNGTSSNALVHITVLAPMPPTLDSPTYSNVTATSAFLSGSIADNGGEPITAVGVVYAPSDLSSNPQIGDGVSTVAPAALASAFSVGVSSLLPNTTYVYAAYASNSAGLAYSSIDTFTTAASLQSFLTSWYGGATNGSAALNADPFNTGVPNIAVFAYLGPDQNPQTASVAQLPQVQMASGIIYYDFFEPAGVSGLTYGAQCSTNLGADSWQSVPDTGSGGEHIFSVPASAHGLLFLRLTVTTQ